MQKRTRTQILTNVIHLLDEKIERNITTAKQYPKYSTDYHRATTENGGLREAIKVIENEMNKYKSI